MIVVQITQIFLFFLREPSWLKQMLSPLYIPWFPGSIPVNSQCLGYFKVLVGVNLLTEAEDA